MVKLRKNRHSWTTMGRARKSPFITTKNARELYGLGPGETVSEAIARRNAKGR